MLHIRASENWVRKSLSCKENYTEKTALYARKNCQNLGIFFPLHKATMISVCFSFLLVTYHCLGESPMPNEAVLLATIITQQSFQTLLKFCQDLTLSSVFMVQIDNPTVCIFLIRLKEKKVVKRLPSCTCLKYFTLKHSTAW